MVNISTTDESKRINCGLSRRKGIDFSLNLSYFLQFSANLLRQSFPVTTAASTIFGIFLDFFTYNIKAYSGLLFTCAMLPSLEGNKSACFYKPIR